MSSLNVLIFMNREINLKAADKVTFPPQVSVLSYSAKFASCYYGPFRYHT